MVHKRRMGILGGTFDPVHMGHLVLAEQAKDELKLSRVFFIPCLSPPHKTQRKLSSVEDRFCMASLAVESNRFFSISDVELKRGGLSYTVDTLRQLKQTYPDADIYFLTGSDVLDEIHTWKDPDEIYNLATIVIAVRPGFDDFDRKNRFAKKSVLVNITGLDVSSSQIRERIKKGQSIKYLVPSRVEEYIKKRKLYTK